MDSGLLRGFRRLQPQLRAWLTWDILPSALSLTTPARAPRGAGGLPQTGGPIFFPWHRYVALGQERSWRQAWVWIGRNETHMLWGWTPLPGSHPAGCSGLTHPSPTDCRTGFLSFSMWAPGPRHYILRQETPTFQEHCESLASPNWSLVNDELPVTGLTGYGYVPGVWPSVLWAGQDDGKPVPSYSATI